MAFRSASRRPIRRIDVHADPHILAGAVGNLLQNAFKFTPAGGHVSESEPRSPTGPCRDRDRSQCGGLPEGKADALRARLCAGRKPTKGVGAWPIHVKLKGVKASGGEIRVRDVPGRGCVFGIDLPLLPTTASQRLRPGRQSRGAVALARHATRASRSPRARRDRRLVRSNRPLVRCHGTCPRSGQWPLRSDREGARL